MDDWQKHNQLIHNLMREVSAHKTIMHSLLSTLQSELLRLVVIESKLKAFGTNFGLSGTKKLHKAEAVAAADGMLIYRDKAKMLKEQDFDIILNIPQQTLRARANPKAKSKLLECDIKKFRAKKLRLLNHMLEHPKVKIGVHNICEVYQDDKEVPFNTLAKTMCSLRRLLHQPTPEGPYILNTTIWVRRGGREEFIGNGYVMNDEFSYLVILEKF